MDFEALEKNIFDVVKEEQIKLGYRKEKIHLFYPLSSLQHLLDVREDVREMLVLLEDFKSFEKEKLGEIEISHQKERFCFMLPPDAVEYVHENYKCSPFFEAFISEVSRHGTTIEDVIGIFKKYSGHVHVEKKSEDFDYLVYFEDGIPDDYRYCLTEEGEHVIYHRFSVMDYEDFGFL